MKRRRRLDDSFVQICTNIFKSVFSYEDTVLLIVYIVYWNWKLYVYVQEDKKSYGLRRDIQGWEAKEAGGKGGRDDT